MRVGRGVAGRQMEGVAPYNAGFRDYNRRQTLSNRRLVTFPGSRKALCREETAKHTRLTAPQGVGGSRRTL